ncbi:hypothetical protein [Megasphaera sueciensis]
MNHQYEKELVYEIGHSSVCGTYEIYPEEGKYSFTESDFIALGDTL